MRLKRTIICLVLGICMLAACVPAAAMADDQVPQGIWTDYIEDAFAGGTGTKEDPYQIASAGQLALLAKEVNSGVYGKTHSGEYFILTADIDLSDHVWVTLGYTDGKGSSRSFSGYFDGNGKKITGLYVDERGKNYSAGLFGCIVAISNEPVIQNLTVENGTVFAGYSTDNREYQYGAGLLIGTITVLGGSNVEYTVVKNCTVSGKVNSSMNAGGLVGDASYTHFENCTADAEVEGICISGGFAGNAFNSYFKDCTANGNVKSGGWSTGGFAGILFSNTTVIHCAAYGDVEAGNWNLGGFVGYVEEVVSIKNSIAMGDVRSNVNQNYDPKVGGFAGTLYNSVKIEKCHAAGKVTALVEGSVGGFIALVDQSNVEDCSYNSYDSQKNPSLEAIGSGDEVTELQIAAKDTAGVLENICQDYYYGHDMVALPGKDATCTEGGYEAGKECKRCGHKEGFAPIGKLDHDLIDVPGKEATCTEDGYEAGKKCKNCDYTEGSAHIDALGHKNNLIHIPAKDATKDKEGNIEYWQCGKCGKFFSDADATNEIDEKDTVIEKLPDIPETGDTENLALWIALLIISGVAVTGLVVKKKSFVK